MLAWVAAAQNTNIAFVGDISFYNKDWSLFKLLIYLMDHKQIKIDYIKINSQDYERWDYRNPELEAELAGRIDKSK
jgi:hypothetical protein